MTRGQVVELPDADLLAMGSQAGERCVLPGHRHHDPHQATWLQGRALSAIILYQRARDGRPSPCRFFPSCSAYALESVEVHGVWRGGWLSLRRLLRCRPLGPSGVDLVPAGRSPVLSCECCCADAPALHPSTTPLTPTVMSSTLKKGG